MTMSGAKPYNPNRPNGRCKLRKICPAPPELPCFHAYLVAMETCLSSILFKTEQTSAEIVGFVNRSLPPEGCYSRLTESAIEIALSRLLKAGKVVNRCGKYSLSEDGGRS